MNNDVCVAERDGGISTIVAQHAQEAGLLWLQRSAALRSPNVTLRLIGFRHDDRIAAHLDGLAVAGEFAWAFCAAALEEASAGSIFTAAVRAIEERQARRTDRLLALAEAVPESRRGLLSAFAWVERHKLQGIVASLLGAPEPVKRLVGVAACAMHRVDPGLLARWVADESPLVRARAFRASGEIGLDELRSPCASAIEDEDPHCQFWAAWSSVLLGERSRGLDTLVRIGLTPDGHRLRAFRLSLQAMDRSAAHGVLQQLAQDPKQLRWLIHGSGIVGDPAYVPWLVAHMVKAETARLAGEAFSLITGADLVSLNLEGDQPEDFEAGPNEDPNDPNVDMDPDEGLPWPNPERIQCWWEANATRFQTGTRYFMGMPVTREHCIEVLNTGYQRQRILAAHYLCLLNPGTPLFNTSAPAWRQQHQLAQMK